MRPPPTPLTDPLSSYQKVHVGIKRYQESLVHLAPFQLEHDGLSREVREEWLWVDNFLFGQRIGMNSRTFVQGSCVSYHYEG